MPQSEVLEFLLPDDRRTALIIASCFSPLPSREISGEGTTSALRDREVDYGSQYSRRDEPHTDIHSELHSGGVTRPSDPKVFRLCLPGPRVARVGRPGAVRCGLRTRARLH